MRRGISAAVMVALLIACVPSPSRVLAPSYGPVNDQPETPIAVLTGIATWYDASKNRAWYTRTTKQGPPIKLYAAAGPELRAYTPNSYLMKPYHIIVKSVKTHVIEKKRAALILVQTVKEVDDLKNFFLL